MTPAPTRIEMRAPLSEAAAHVHDARLRPARTSDIAELGRLMLSAYRGTADDEGETEDDAVAVVRKTYSGEYGEFDAAASRVVEDGGRLLCAVLVTRWQDQPFVAFTMTDAAAKRQGLARRALVAAMGALQSRGETRLALVVTAANAPAVALYRSLGFVAVPPARPAAGSGYSGTPLPRKLGLVEGMRVCVLDAPGDYAALLGPLAPALAMQPEPDGRTALVHCFVTKRTVLQARLHDLRRTLRDEAVLWVSWPKKSARQVTDLTEDVVRELALPLGFVDVKVCAVDATWSGLKLVVRKALRRTAPR